MFIVTNYKMAYKLTRKSLSDALKYKLRVALKPIYAEELLEDIVCEVISHTEFPKIIDTDSIYIYNNKKFYEYVMDNGIKKTEKVYSITDFAPNYTGAEIKEINNLLNYSYLGELSFMHCGYDNPMIVPTSDGANVISVTKDVVSYVTEVLKSIVKDNVSEKIAKNIVTDILFPNTILWVSIFQSNDLVQYAFHSDGSVEKITPFSVKGLYEAIMKYLPKLSTISKSAERLSILMHNHLLYNVDICEYELNKPFTINDEGNAVFRKVINGIEFFLDHDTGEWCSDFILGDTNDFEFENREPYKGFGGSYHNFEAHYKGFLVMKMSGETKCCVRNLNPKIPILWRCYKFGTTTYKYVFRYPDTIGRQFDHDIIETYGRGKHFKTYFRLTIGKKPPKTD